MPIVEPNSVVKGGPITVKSLFGKFNHIPVYQRDFVWQGKQVKALWGDLIQHYHTYAKNESLVNTQGYFLGAMVVIENGEEIPDEVIDGQQRLTSLTTMATICLDFLRSITDPNEEVKAWIETLGPMIASPDGGRFIPKLSFSDNEITEFFFNSTYKNLQKTEKESYWNETWCREKLKRKKSPFFKMKEAISIGYEELEKFLAKVDDEEKKIRRLISFIQLLTEGVIILRIKAMSYTNAYAIFESLNNRGIPLSQSDLIKNELLSACDDSTLLEVGEYWQNARQIIDSIELKTLSMPDFIHYSYISRHGMEKANKLYDQIKRRLSSPDAAKIYAEELEKDANALYSLTEQFDDKWTPETMDMLRDVKNVLNIKHCYPFLIAAYRIHCDNPSTFAQYVAAVMNFAFRYMKVLEDPLENFSLAIGVACKMMVEGKEIDEIRAHFKMEASDDQFVKRFEDSSFSNTKLAYFTVYYLEKVLLKKGTVPTQHGLEQNLEHIMPKKPNNKWPNATKWKKENPEEYNEYLWKIGNLIPLPASINKSLQNKPIVQKIQDPSGIDYSSKNHSLISPQTISSFLIDGQWTKESIDLRQKELAEKLALKAWPL
jgi:hypothetical protein